MRYIMIGQEFNENKTDYNPIFALMCPIDAHIQSYKPLISFGGGYLIGLISITYILYRFACDQMVASRILMYSIPK